MNNQGVVYLLFVHSKGASISVTCIPNANEYNYMIFHSFASLLSSRTVGNCLENTCHTIKLLDDEGKELTLI